MLYCSSPRPVIIDVALPLRFDHKGQVTRRAFQRVLLTVFPFPSSRCWPTRGLRSGSYSLYSPSLPPGVDQHGAYEAGPTHCIPLPFLQVLTNTGPTKPERSRIVQLDSTQLTPGGADCLDGGASATHSLTWDYAAVGESRRPSSGAGAAPLASPETVSCGSGAEPTRCVSQPQLSNGYGPRSPREGRHSPHSPPRSRRSHSATTPLAHSTPLPPTLRPPGAGNGLNASSVPTIPRLLAATDDATGGDTYRVVSELCLRPPPPPLPVTARLASDMWQPVATPTGWSLNCAYAHHHHHRCLWLRDSPVTCDSQWRHLQDGLWTVPTPVTTTAACDCGTR